jgi:tetratricopeptide (TPR) repeat protein
MYSKSEVALELAYMLQETLPDMSVIWLDASTKTSLYKGLERFHRHTRHAQPHQDAVFDITAVYSWLDSSMYGARLLVLDNADLAAFSEPILHGLLKQREQVHLLITTRNRLFALEHVHPIDLTEMPVMTVEAGGELLSSYAGSENVSSHHETGQLISYLESCPFALKRIGSHMRATGNGVGAYLAIAQHGPSFLTSLLTGPHDSQQNPIIREDSFEWLYSVNTLTAQSRDAIPVLLVLSCICSSEICEEILDALADTESKRYALDVLRSYSLLRPTKSGKTWDVPCLVALAAKAQLYHHPNRTGYLGDALWIVVSVGSSRKDLTLTPPHYWAHAASLLKTYVHLTTEDELDLGTMEAIIQLGIRLCRYLVAGARAAEAVLTLRQLILWASNRARNLVPSFDKLRCKLGTALHSDGHYADAEEETRQVLRSQILTIGEDDTNTLHSLNNLGVYHHDQSRFPMAESFHRKALQMKRAKFGTHHVETLVTLNNLALSLQSQKKLAEAELFFSQALRGRKRLLSAYHADTLVSVSNLGVLKQLQGQLKQSRRLHEAALSGREQTLGAEHPETLKSRGNVALLLQHEGHYDQAIEMLLEVRQTQRVAVGRCHPDTIKSSKNLAIMLHQQNKFSDAETVASELLEVLEERHGKGHPETFATSQHLATLLHWQGKLEEAFDIVAWLYDMRSELFGVDHPDTISSREYLAEIESELTCSGQGSSVVILSMI